MKTTTYKVFIPKYSFDIKNGQAVKTASDASLSIEIDAATPQDAMLQVLNRLDSNKLVDSGYCVEDLKVYEVLVGQDMLVYINGVKDSKVR